MLTIFRLNHEKMLIYKKLFMKVFYEVIFIGTIFIYLPDVFHFFLNV